MQTRAAPLVQNPTRANLSLVVNKDAAESGHSANGDGVCRP